MKLLSVSWMPENQKSRLVQVKAWCCQVPNHYLSQCWPSSMAPYKVPRPQWVNIWDLNKMIAILQITLPSAFSRKKSSELSIAFHWNILKGSNWLTYQHWFRLCLGAVRQQDIIWTNVEGKIWGVFCEFKIWSDISWTKVEGEIWESSTVKPLV